MKHRIGVAMMVSTALAAGALAQDPNQSDPQDTKPPEKQEEEKPRPPLPPYKLAYEFGLANWGLDGNFHKFRQYATPPDGLHLRSLVYDHAFNNLTHVLRFGALAPGEDDYRAFATVFLNYGDTRVGASTDRSRFFDTTPFVIDGSDRQASEGFVSQKLGPNVLLAVRSSLDQQDHNFDPPKDPRHQRTNFWNASATGSLGAGFFDLSFIGSRYFDRTNILPDTESRRWALSYAHQLAPTLNLQGSLARSIVDVAGDRNEVNSWSFSGDWQAGEATDLLFDFRHDSLDLPTVQNAFVRERSMARARLVHRWPGWSGQLGYKRSDAERVRGDQSFVDTPTWHSFDAKVSGRISPTTRLTARIGRESLEGSATMVTLDPRALYWDERMFGQLKVDVGTEMFSGYLVYGFREQKNDRRDTSVRNHGLTLGGSYQAKPDLELYFEATTDIWGGRSGDPQNPDLDSYLGDGSVLTLGANWTIGPHAYATGSFTHYSVSNENPMLERDTNVRGSFLTTSFNYRMPSGQEFGLTIAPWRYTDRAYSQMGYNAFLVALTAKGKF